MAITALAIVDIGVSYNENLDKVEQILNETCLNLTKKLKNIKNEVKCVGIQNFGDIAAMNTHCHLILRILMSE